MPCGAVSQGSPYKSRPTFSATFTAKRGHSVADVLKRKLASTGLAPLNITATDLPREAGVVALKALPGGSEVRLLLVNRHTNVDRAVSDLGSRREYLKAPTPFAHHGDATSAPIRKGHVFLGCVWDVAAAVRDAEPMTLLQSPQHLRKRLVNLNVCPVLAVIANIVNCPGTAKRCADYVLLGAH